MKKAIIWFSVLLSLLSTPLFSQEDPFKKFKIPDKFRNYRQGESMGGVWITESRKSKYLERWDIDDDGVMDVGEVYDLNRGLEGFVLDKNPSQYFFNLDGGLSIECHEVFEDPSRDGDFNGNETRKCNPPIDYDRKLPFGVSFLV